MRLSTFLPAGGCKGKTERGRNCQSKDVFENGYCKHHGGEGQSLTARRLDVAIELAKIRAQRRGHKGLYHAAKLRILEAQRAEQERENARRQNPV
jgi:hypothetical protein